MPFTRNLFTGLLSGVSIKNAFVDAAPSATQRMWLSEVAARLMAVRYVVSSEVGCCRVLGSG